MNMNMNVIEGNWKQVKGAVQEQWGKLTDDQLAKTEGNREKLVGEIQQTYGIAKDEAEKQLEQFEEGLKAAA